MIIVYAVFYLTSYATQINEFTANDSTILSSVIVWTFANPYIYWFPKFKFSKELMQEVML